MKKTIIIFLGILLSATVAFASAPILKTAFLNLSYSKAFSSDITLKINGYSKEMQKDVNIVINGKGAFDERVADKVTATFNLKFKTNLYKQTKPFVIDLRKSPTDVYVRASGLKDVLGIILEEYDGKWYKMNIDDTKEEIGINTQKGDDENLNVINKLFDIEKDLGIKKINNIKAHGYKFVLNKNNIPSYIEDAVSRGIIEKNSFESKKQEILDTTKNIVYVNGEIWVDEKNQLPLDINLSAKYKTDEGSLFNISFIAHYSKYNKPVNVIYPKKFIDLSEEIKSNQKRAKSASFKASSASLIPALINDCEENNKIEISTYINNDDPIDFSKSYIESQVCTKDISSFRVKLYPKNSELYSQGCVAYLSENGSEFNKCD